MLFNTELVNQQIWGLVRFMRATTMDAHEANVVVTALKNGGGKTIADLCDTAGEAGKLMAAVHYVSQIAAERDALEAKNADLLTALENMVAWNGKRGGDDDALLPADQQDEEVAQAMRVIAKAKGGADEQI